MMQEKSSNDHDENKENLMKDLETTVEIKEKVIIFFFNLIQIKKQVDILKYSNVGMIKKVNEH